MFNKRTGRLVSGHQRLSCLDAIHGDADYSLTVAVVDLSEQDEAQQLIFFNNRSASGDWDTDILGGLIRDESLSLDVEEAGFDRMDLELLFDDADLAPTFALENQTPEAQRLFKESQELGDEARAAKKEAAQKKRQAYYKDQEAANDAAGHLVVVFDSSDDRRAFLDAHALDPDLMYLDAAVLRTLCGTHTAPSAG